MKKYIILLLLFTTFLQVATAQDNTIKVVDFYLNEQDISANTHGNIVYDQNGEKCALIKIRTNQRGFSFDVGMLGITKTVQKTGEIWVYVPEGVKHITLYHNTLATLKYDFNQTLQKARTYILELQAKEVYNIVEDKTKVGTINLDIYPPTASIVINSIPVKLDQEGKEQVQLYYGTFTYDISDPNYYPVNGLLKIDSEKPQSLKIRMKQAFGWLNINCAEGLDGASIYIDNQSIDTAAATSRIPVKHGSHTVRIENPLYYPYSADFSISDSTVTALNVTLQQNYGIVALNCADPLATIFIDGQAKAKGSWTGKVSTGNHTFECKRGYHTSSTKTLNIGNGSNITVPLDAPTPIYGTLNLTTDPEGAKVFINDTLAGTTPLVNKNILVGKKILRIEKQFYTTEEREITLSPDNIINLSVPLTNRVPVNISANTDSTKVYLNGEYKGLAPYADTINGGKYSIRLEAGKKYRTINSTIDITPYNNEFNYKLKKNFARANEIYMDVNYMLPTNEYAKNIPALGLNIGTYLHNFNIEAGYEMENGNDEVYFTSDLEKSQKVEISDLKNIIFKVGYGITLTNRMRLTPQIGVQYNRPQASLYSVENYSEPTIFSLSATASCRFTFAFLPFMGVTITPSYRIPVKESLLYELTSDISPRFDSSNNGFAIKAGFVFFISL